MLAQERGLARARRHSRWPARRVACDDVRVTPRSRVFGAPDPGLPGKARRRAYAVVLDDLGRAAAVNSSDSYRMHATFFAGRWTEGRRQASEHEFVWSSPEEFFHACHTWAVRTARVTTLNRAR